MKKQKSGNNSDISNKLHKNKKQIHLYLMFISSLTATLIIHNSDVQNLAEYEVHNLQQTILVKIHSTTTKEAAKVIGLDAIPELEEIYSGFSGDFDTENFLVKIC